MKKTTLFFVLAFMTFIGASAQWTKPVPQASSFAADETFYLYNTEAGAFFLGNNDWGTRASYKTSQGFKVKFLQAVNEGDTWDGSSYYWTNFIEANDYSDSPNMVGQWAKVFIQSNGIWVDQASSTADSDNKWTVNIQEDNTYKIGLSAANSTYTPDDYPDSYIGAIGTKNDTRLYLCDQYEAESEEEYNSFQTSWIFVSVEEYDRIHSSLVLYDKAMELNKAIENAETECPGIDIQSEKDTYTNTENTLEALQTAIDKIKTKVLDYKIQHSSPTSPLDMTSCIANADYSDETGAGWEGSGLGFWNKCVQLFDYPNFDTYQTINGLLYPGIYKLNMQGYYREGGFMQVYNDYKNNQGILHDYAFLYTIVNGDSIVRPVISIAAEPSTEALNGGVDEVQLDATTWYPNMMSTGQIYLAAGHYNDNGLYVVIPKGVTSVKIGYRKPATVASDWSFMDNWSLTYYGQGQDSYEYMRDQTLTTTRDYSDLTTDIKYHQPILQAYTDARQSLKAETQQETIWTKVKALPQLAKNFRDNVLAYIEYKNVYDKGYAIVLGDEFAGEDFDILADYIDGEGAEILQNCPMNTEEIIAETARLSELIKTAQENGLKPGADITTILKNPDFTSADGWNNYNGALGVGLTSFPVCEAFNCAFEVSQDVTGIPNGIYQLDAFAFYRPGGNGTYDGSEEVQSQLFLNSTEHNVKHIMDDPSATIAYQDGSWMNDYETAMGFVPNSSNGTSTAYSAGRYDQTLYGLVTDGKLHIGIRSTATAPDSRWTTWSKFRLTFHGYEFTDEIVESLEKDIITPAEKLLEYKMGQTEYQNLSDAIETARTETQSRKCFQALCDLGSCIDQAKLSISNYTLLTEKCQNLRAAIDRYQSTAVPASVTYATRIANEIEEGIIEATYTNDDLIAQITKIADAMSRLRIPKNYIDATEDNPVDMTQVIVNSAYTDGFNDWSGTTPSYINFNTCEFYQMNYNCYQVVTNLPVGKYQVGIQAYFRYGFSQGDYDTYTASPDANNDGILYAESAEGSYSQPLLRNSSKASTTNIGGVGDWTLANGLHVPNTLEAASYWFGSAMYPNAMDVCVGEDGTLTLGLKKDVITTGDWTAFTNWTLTYYGNPATDIETVNSVEQTTNAGGYYDISGRHLSTDKSALKKGIYIHGNRKYINVR